MRETEESEVVDTGVTEVADSEVSGVAEVTEVRGTWVVVDSFTGGSCACCSRDRGEPGAHSVAAPLSSFLLGTETCHERGQGTEIGGEGFQRDQGSC